jgi:ABC-type transport system involved in multi-copper enzyme maturation permease subunit
MLSAVIHRELATLLRNRRMLFGQLGVAGLLTLLVALRWPTEAHVALSGERSQQVFRLVCYGLLIILLLLLPVFPATSIIREKKQGTLALLLNTPLGPWRIFFGKLAAVMGLAGILLTLSFPAVGACYAMGGLSLAQLAHVYELFAVVSLMCSVLGLLVSCHANTIDAAVRWTYAIVLFLAVLSQGPHYFFQGTAGMLADLGEMLRGLSPFAALMSLLGAGDVGGKGLMSTTDVAAQFMKTAFVISVVGSLWTVSRINHRIFDRSRAAGAISNDQNLAVRAFRRLFFLVDPQRRSLGIPAFINPVMVKEFRCRRFGRLHWLLRLVAICAVLSLGLTYATTAGTVDWGVETIGGIMVVMQVSLIILITPSLSAGLVSNERESRGWQLLQTTPMSTTRIVRGKLASVILPLMLILCATLPGYVVMVYIEPGMTFQVQRVVVCLAATAVFAMLLSSAVGCLFKKTAAATAAAYAALLAVCVVPLLIWLGRDAPFGHDTVEGVLTVNPVAAALSVIRMPGFQNYELIPGNWWFLGLASIVSLGVLLLQTYRISRPQ